MVGQEVVCNGVLSGDLEGVRVMVDQEGVSLVMK